jgi:pimeloyl-ACP methyl ester carboxylesterase
VEQVTFSGLNGLQLVADVRGESDAWPVLFLHGGGQTRHAWGRTAEYVADRGWRSISLDLRGHGDSAWSDGDYSISAYQADCLSVIDQLGLPPVLVGASLGGTSAMLAEGMSDQIVSSGLVLVDIAPKPNRDGIKRISAFMRSGLSGFDTLDDVAAAIAAYTPNRVRPVNLDGLSKVVRERGGRWYWHWDPRTMSLDRSDEQMAAFAELLDAAIRNISVPTLLIRGLLSDIVTQESVDHLRSLKPDISIVEVSGAAHMIAGDKNDVFSEAVLDFLDHRIRPLTGSPK